MLSQGEIRDVLLKVIAEKKPKPGSNSNLQSASIIREAASRLNVQRDLSKEQAILSEFSRLFYTGYLAWGHDLNNQDPPFCHITAQGEVALKQVSRDPANPEGYKNYLDQNAKLPPISESYLDEGLDCYISGQYKAAAVMLGAACERLILDVRDEVVSKIKRDGEARRPQLEDWKVKKVLGGLKNYLDEKKRSLAPELKETYESYWPAFTQQIRVARNEAGHPSSIAPVTFESVHAGFLVFPSVAGLAAELKNWASGGVK
ncbi:MAG: hypothetical protein MI744_06805 [Pseudomonadales bacterium]|jgi:hypothetical protein|nr:hypothetical protein [Pseudomonadales bacterium]|tara:strand:- start:1532 stop:2311 length:780 start_codon:yes stop_codon:yes gene_type:complete